jgi:hypothetical protein
VNGRIIGYAVGSRVYAPEDVEVIYAAIDEPEPPDVPPAALSAALDAWQAACMAEVSNKEAMRHTLAAAFRAVQDAGPRRSLDDTVQELRDRLASSVQPGPECSR